MKRLLLILLVLFVGVILSIFLFELILSIRESNKKPTLQNDASQNEISTSSQFLIKADHPKVGNPSPFMTNGTPMGYDHVFIKDAAKKYPDITSCLKGDKSDGVALNLLNFRWSDFETDEEVRLCVFYVADILNSSDKIVDWFNAQGMPNHIFTPSLTPQPPGTSFAVYGDFPERIPKTCSFYNTFVRPLFLYLAPWRTWYVRENAAGLRINYMLDDRIAGIQVRRGSCLN